MKAIEQDYIDLREELINELISLTTLLEMNCVDTAITRAFSITLRLKELRARREMILENIRRAKDDCKN